jgi:hypothetical protein
MTRAPFTFHVFSSPLRNKPVAAVSHVANCIFNALQLIQPVAADCSSKLDWIVRVRFQSVETRYSQNCPLQSRATVQNFQNFCKPLIFRAATAITATTALKIKVLENTQNVKTRAPKEAAA